VRSFLRENIQFLLTLLLWLAVGRYLGPAVYGVVPISLILFRQKGRYGELLMGFFFVLILSDSRQPGLEFAVSLKNVYIVMFSLFFFLDKEVFFPINRTYQKFIPFFLIAVLCIFFSEDIPTSIEKTLSYFLVLLVVTNVTVKLLRENAPEFLSRLVFFGTALLFAGLVLKVLSPGVVTLEDRYTGILGNPNGLGVFSFLFFMLYTIVNRLYPELFSRVEKLGILSAVIISIVFCGSRSSIFSVMIFLIFNYFYRLSSFLGFIIFLTILMVYQYISLNLVSILTYLDLQSYFRVDTLEDGSGRFIAWEFAWQKIQDNVFLGKGFFYTEYLFKKFYVFLSAKGHQGNAHNSFLTFWLDTGLIGLILYSYAFISSFVRASRSTYMAIPVLYAIIFSANFESWLTGSLNPLTIQVWIILTVLTFSGTKEGEEKESEPVDESNGT
jgi:O-antigen ligase